MQVREIMTKMPACCLPENSLRLAAQAMLEQDCGAIPVVENKGTMRLVGIVTDRDIVCRAVAQGRNPMTATIRDCMSSPVVTVTPDTSLEECCHIMADDQIRRLPVVDADGILCGMVTQAHIARNAEASQTADVLKVISQRKLEPSNIGDATLKKVLIRDA